MERRDVVNAGHRSVGQKASLDWTPVALHFWGKPLLIWTDHVFREAEGLCGSVAFLWPMSATFCLLCLRVKEEREDDEPEWAVQSRLRGRAQGADLGASVHEGEIRHGGAAAVRLCGQPWEALEEAGFHLHTSAAAVTGVQRWTRLSDRAAMTTTYFGAPLWLRW